MKFFNLTEDEKKIHNKKVDRRRKTIMKILKGIVNSLKKFWKYLGETELANQNKNNESDNNSSSGRYAFEDHDWF